MLTPAAVKAAQPQARAYKLFDQRGLFLFIAASGLRSWRWKYRRAGKEKLITLGQFPAMSLPEARAARDTARERLQAGVAPGAPRAHLEQIETFVQLARAWHAHQAPRWSTVHAADVLASLERDAFPALGELPIGEIDAPAILEVLNDVEGRGCLTTAKRLRQRLSSIFRFGIVKRHCTDDPAAILSRMLMPARPARQHAALLSADECKQLLADCDRVGARPIVRLASRFLALTAVRLDAVRGMRWGELEDLDGPAPVWRVPAARMKLALVKKDDERFDHLVPLSAPAVQLLRQAARENGYDTHSPAPADRLVFSTGAAPIGEGAIRQLYIDAGYGGRHVPHGWRASFSTILNKAVPAERASIDRALAHSPKDKVEAAYNRDEMLERRRALFDRWAALLEA
ncbi:integrase arm-type DNA-binding domain-containing protein [Novosphingobium sp.]|uniref:tyrosine-type recombinase/integrase n=1 Tax=Novosphingobium sp. TaxID=1874826 RepID=UPI0031D4D553